MKRVLVRTGGAALVLALGCWSPVSGADLPFEPTPQGLQDYANNADWGAKKLKFSNIGSSREFPNQNNGCFLNVVSSDYSLFSCGGGYAEIRSPLGVQTCELSAQMGLTYNTALRQLKYTDKLCNDLTPVSAGPPKEKPSKPNQSSQSVQPARPAGITLKKYQFFSGGIIVFLLGIGAGMLVSKREY